MKCSLFTADGVSKEALKEDLSLTADSLFQAKEVHQAIIRIRSVLLLIKVQPKITATHTALILFTAVTSFLKLKLISSQAQEL